ncbi:MAG: hypothetical protein K2J51_08255 [Alistipes sp.]|nr:hypothetical protein [Alistipes sp.]
MGLLSYIMGNRKGREAHDLEREAMRDSFLADALDGYDNTDDPGLAERLCRMGEKVRLQSIERNNIAVAGGLRDMRPPMPMTHVMYETDCETSPNMPDIYEHDFEIQPDISTVPGMDLRKPARRRIRYVYRLVAVSVVLCICVAAYELGIMNGAQRAEMPAQSSIAADNAAETYPSGIERQTSPQSKVAQSQKESDCAISAAPMTDTVAGAPRPTDGYKAYYEYIYDRLAAAAAAGADGSKIGGVVVLSFTVDATGRPRDFKVVESPSPETAETLIRIIDSGPIWTRPGEVQAFAVTLR